MSDVARYWRVTFFPDGRVNKVRPIKGPGHSRWVVVEAEDEESAKRKGYNIYCARKKRERLAKLASESRCSCGRALDGATIDRGPHRGAQHRRCATCRERAKLNWTPNYKQRVANGTNGSGVAERNEPARVELNLERQRDRRSEIRLETLIEVREQWITARNVGLYGQWLTREIEAIAGKKAGAA